MFIFLEVRNKSGFVVGQNRWKRFMASRGFTSEIARLVQRTLAKLRWKSGGTVVAKVVFCWGGLTRFFFKATFLARWWFHIFSEVFRWVEFHQLAFIKDFSVETREKMGKLNET